MNQSTSHLLQPTNEGEHGLLEGHRSEAAGALNAAVPSPLSPPDVVVPLGGDDGNGGADLAGQLQQAHVAVRIAHCITGQDGAAGVTGNEEEWVGQCWKSY